MRLLRGLPGFDAGDKTSCNFPIQATGDMVATKAPEGASSSGILYELSRACAIATFAMSGDLLPQP